MNNDTKPSQIQKTIVEAIASAEALLNLILPRMK